jgi:hypothetical protein
VRTTPAVGGVALAVYWRCKTPRASIDQHGVLIDYLRQIQTHKSSTRF